MNICCCSSAIGKGTNKYWRNDTITLCIVKRRNKEATMEGRPQPFYKPKHSISIKILLFRLFEVPFPPSNRRVQSDQFPLRPFGIHCVNEGDVCFSLHLFSVVPRMNVQRMNQCQPHKAPSPLPSQPFLQSLTPPGGEGEEEVNDWRGGGSKQKPSRIMRKRKKETSGRTDVWLSDRRARRE